MDVLQQDHAFRVAVFNMDIVGTLNPLLPVLAELVDLGCEVRYHLSKEDFVEPVKRSGVTPIHFDQYIGTWDQLMLEEADWLTANGLEAELLPPGVLIPERMLYYCLPSGLCLARRLLQTWESDHWRPDLILYNVMLLHPALAARKLGVPCASFSTYPGPGTPMHLAGIPAEKREAYDLSLSLREGQKQANEIAKQMFVTDVLKEQLLCRHFNKELNLVFSLPALGGAVPAYQQALLDDSSFLWVGSTGSSDHRANSQELSEDPWLAPSGVKVLLVVLGTMTVDIRWESPEHMSSNGPVTGRSFSQRVWSELSESLGGRSDLRVIVGIGPRPDALDVLGEVPSNFVALPCFDQVKALAHADAFITHGGANSIKEGLIAGVPTVVIPFNVDQHSNGDAIMRNGAGLTFPDVMATPRGQLAAAVEAVLCNADFRKRSQELGAELLGAGGAKAAAAACMALAAKGQSLRRAEQAGA